jgi:hypothetical protein
LRNGISPLQAAIVHGDSKSVGLLLSHKSIRVTEEDTRLLSSLRVASDEDFWAILDDFTSETEHLYGCWTVEPMNARRAALEEIQTLVETGLPVSEQCFSHVQERSTPDRREGNTLHSSINLLWLLLRKGDNSWWTIEELGTGGRPRASTLPVSLAWLVFVPCMCAAIVYAFWNNLA